MAAIVHPMPLSESFSAWCRQHRDGVIDTKKKARAWADQHNAEQHPNEETVTGL